MRRYLLPLVALTCTPAFASEVELSVEIPQLDVAEYHRPYVAIWLEGAEQNHVANLAVWYDGKKADKEGEKWLKDLRQWWRRSGRGVEMPLDGISGATKAVGKQVLRFSDKDAAFKDLEAGQYNIVVEAAREVGGRELLRVPLQWPISQASNQSVNGTSELGAIQLVVKP